MRANGDDRTTYGVVILDGSVQSVRERVFEQPGEVGVLHARGDVSDHILERKMSH